MALVFKTSYPTFADLPTIGNIDGDLRRVADTGDAYRWDENSTTWVAYATVPALEETDSIGFVGAAGPGMDVSQASGGGGGGAVTSVNGQTGAVVLDAVDVGAVSSAEFTYDFANDGGAVGTISLNGGATLPANIVILSMVAQPITPFVGTGNVDIQIDGVSLSGGLQAATDLNLNGVYDYIGNTKKVSATAVPLDLVIDTDPLTAGKYNFHITFQTYTP